MYCKSDFMTFCLGLQNILYIQKLWIFFVVFFVLMYICIVNERMILVESELWFS